MPALRDPLAYFEASYVPEPNSGCWIWLRSLMDGYGSISVNGRSKRAHRMAWQFFRGAIPNGLHVLHRCDVRCCVNPDHLFLGTEADNSADKITKGRDRHLGLPGELNGRAKLTREQVEEIRRRSRLGENWKVLAKEFGVHHQAIWKIRNGLRWRGDR